MAITLIDTRTESRQISDNFYRNDFAVSEKINTAGALVQKNTREEVNTFIFC